jgi:hypothetical protein
MFAIAKRLILIAVEALLLLAGKRPRLERLPGDIVIRTEHLTIYLPLTTGLLLSLLIFAILWLIRR